MRLHFTVVVIVLVVSICDATIDHRSSGLTSKHLRFSFNRHPKTCNKANTTSQSIDSIRAIAHAGQDV